MDDRCDRAKRRVVEAHASEQHLERAEVTFMRELGLEHVEAQLAGLRPVAPGRHELESCPGVDETPDQPGARDAVDMDSLARDPRTAMKVAQLPAVGHPLQTPLRTRLEAGDESVGRLPTGCAEEVEGAHLGESSLEPSDLGFELRAATLGQRFP